MNRCVLRFACLRSMVSFTCSWYFESFRFESFLFLLLGLVRPCKAHATQIARMSLPAQTAHVTTFPAQTAHVTTFPAQTAHVTTIGFGHRKPPFTRHFSSTRGNRPCSSTSSSPDPHLRPSASPRMDLLTACVGPLREAMRKAHAPMPSAGVLRLQDVQLLQVTHPSSLYSSIPHILSLFFHTSPVPPLPVLLLQSLLLLLLVKRTNFTPKGAFPSRRQ